MWVCVKCGGQRDPIIYTREAVREGKVEGGVKEGEGGVGRGMEKEMEMC